MYKVVSLNNVGKDVIAIEEARITGLVSDWEEAALLCERAKNDKMFRHCKIVIVGKRKVAAYQQLKKAEKSQKLQDWKEAARLLQDAGEIKVANQCRLKCHKLL